MPSSAAGDPRALGRATIGANVGSMAAQPVFIELGRAAQRPLIARDGSPVPILHTLPDKIGDIVRGGDTVVVKVLTQSVPAGTTVPQGTSIDLMLSSPFNVPLGVFDGVHIALASRDVANVYNTFIREDPAVRNVLARSETFDTLSETDRGIITQAATANGVTVTNQAGSTLANVFVALQAANTFGA